MGSIRNFLALQKHGMHGNAIVTALRGRSRHQHRDKTRRTPRQKNTTNNHNDNNNEQLYTYVLIYSHAPVVTRAREALFDVGRGRGKCIACAPLLALALIEGEIALLRA